MKIALNMRLSPVFIRDRGIDMHHVIFRIKGIHYIMISFFHKCPTQFSGPCKFIIVGIELLIQVNEF